MARRIEIELTSARPDGSWTWRAAGAREPRGVLDGGLLPEGAKAGDVLRAEAEFEIEGISIVAVLAPRENTRQDPERIEIIGSGRPDGPSVTTQLVGRSDRRPGDRRRERDDSRSRRDRDAGRPPGGRELRRPRRETPAGDEAQPERAGTGPEPRRRPERTRDQAERPQPTDGDQPEQAARPNRAERADRTGARDGRQRGPAGGGRTSREQSTARQDDRTGRRREGRSPEPAGTERRARRFNPGRAHRQAVMASLPPEQQPVAEQVLRGGIPAVRTALHLEREKAIAEGRQPPNTDQLIAMAESLLPRLKAAEWRDRAEAASKDVEEISLRDLRSVVAGADSARDDESRALAAGLREALERRVDALRRQWTEEIAAHLDDGRVVRALRLAARPPEPAARMDPDLLQRLSDAAGEAMGPDTPVDRWLALVDAVAASPVRRSVKPVGLPADPGPELRRVAHQQSGRIPALAALLGVAIPPPPAPTPARRGGARTRPGRGTTAGPGSKGPEAAAPEEEDTITPPAQTEAPDGDVAPAPGSGAGEAAALAPDPGTPPPQVVVPPAPDPTTASEPGGLAGPTGSASSGPGEADTAELIGSAPEVAAPAGPMAPAPEPTIESHTDGEPESAKDGQDAMVMEELGQTVGEG